MKSAALAMDYRGDPLNGKTSMIHHTGIDVFRGLEIPFQATRYHSLVIERSSLPDFLEITAWTETKAGGMEEIMGVRHRKFQVSGVQFHPESILTQHGHELLRNFLGSDRCWPPPPSYPEGSSCRGTG